MRDRLRSLLKQHWKVDHFRPLQEEICCSILDRKDSLVLLPTGGGKSLCYQLPSLLLKGPTLVVSPLISLMQDQVAKANSKGIKSMALRNDQPMNKQLDNIAYGNYKLIYCSPEKTLNKLFLGRLAQLNIQCIAVDEAHCISQWGSDFRPAYKKLAQLRDLLPKIPVIALTASATPVVIKDIISELKLVDHQHFQSSFERNNIFIELDRSPDKLGSIIRRLKQQQKTTIIYCSSRRETEEISAALNVNDLSSTYFHGGLSAHEKQDRLNAWISNTIPIIVATNAFGMGIDKADVHFVFHLNLPASLEHYYQEIGRAGRNGQAAKAVLYFQPQDASRAKKQFLAHLPKTDFIEKCYKHLCNYLNIAYGEGHEGVWDLSFTEFCSTYQLSPKKVAHCLTLFDQGSIFHQFQHSNLEAKAKFLCSPNQFKSELEQGTVSQAKALQSIARKYPGIFDQELSIDLDEIVQSSTLKFSEIIALFNQYHEQGIMSFNYNKSDLRLIGLVPREDQYTLRELLRNNRYYLEGKKEKIEAMIAFASKENQCKQKELLAYFGEEKKENCQQCSSKCCQKEKTSLDITAITQEIVEILSKGALSPHQLKLSLPQYPIDQIAAAIEQLEEKQVINRNTLDQYTKP
ncbi:MAG: RecQ family ATP-dependent DNA helicase [Flavobacteriaceae bacterium]